MMKKFRTGGYTTLIEEVEIEKETTHFYYIKGSRVQKIQSWQGKFHETHQEAKEYLIDIKILQIKRLDEQRIQYEKELFKLEDL